jgi:hypothetical protein
MFQNILKRQRAGVGAGPLNTTLATTGAVTHDYYPQKRKNRHHHNSNHRCCYGSNSRCGHLLRELGYVVTSSIPDVQAGHATTVWHASLPSVCLLRYTLQIPSNCGIR